MKRTVCTTIIATLFVALLFTACNADASAGLFRQLADAKAPVGIRYRQIIGKDATDLYYLTDNGIYKSTGPSSTIVRENAKGSPVLEAYLDVTGANNYLIYLINTNDGAMVYRYNQSNKDDDNMRVTSTLTSCKIKALLPNGSILVQGLSGGKNAYAVITHDYENDTVKSEVVFDDLDGFALDGILFQSGLQQVSTNFILSFVNSSKEYKHFFNNKTNEIKLNSSLAAYTIETKLYLLTKNGALYGSDVPAGSTTATSMGKNSKMYPSNAFLYAVTDGSTTHLLTKSSNSEEGIYVFSFTKGSNAADSASGFAIKEGYARQMNNVSIVSAFEKTPGVILVATERNGMFDLTINAANANKNDTSNGSSSGPENYTI